MDRRQEILNAATASFAQFGYKATTMDQVAKIANVGKGTIYTFFANKNVLFEEIVLQMIAQLIQEIEQIISQEESFQQNALHILKKTLEFREVHKLYAKILEEAKALQTPATTSILIKVEQEILKYIEVKVQLAMTKGSIQQCDAKMLSFLLLKSYIAFIVEWQEIHARELTEKDIVELFQCTIFSGLLPR